MSEITSPILLDSTGKEIRDAILLVKEAVENQSVSGGGSDDCVKSVNGILPDENGNVEVPNGATSWNDLTDKPFYDTREFEDKTYSYDGNMDGKESILYSANNGETSSERNYLIKISDEVPDISTDSRITLSWDGSFPGSYDVEADGIFDVGQIVVVDDESVLIVKEQIPAPFDEEIILFPGVYVVQYITTWEDDNGTNEEIGWISNFFVSTLKSGELKKLDEKFTSGSHLTVTATYNEDEDAVFASHTPKEIRKHIDNGGSVVLNQEGTIYQYSSGDDWGCRFQITLADSFSARTLWAEVFDNGLVDFYDDEFLGGANITPQEIGALSSNNPVATGGFSLGRTSGTSIASGSFACGNEVTASGAYSHAEGNGTVASSQSSHAEGQNTEASGQASHAEGSATKTSSWAAHAEGIETAAKNYGTHAEGCHTVAGSGSLYTTSPNSQSFCYSHAEGYSTLASGTASHAEGQCTTASARSTHAEGEGTIAAGLISHVQGAYNHEDISKIDRTTGRRRYAHIVGNGTADDKRSNAHTIDWNGNAWFAGDVTVGGSWVQGPDSSFPSGAEKLVKQSELESVKPHIGDNGNWFIGDTDTGVSASGSGGSTGGGWEVVADITLEEPVNKCPSIDISAYTEIEVYGEFPPTPDGVAAPYLKMGSAYKGWGNTNTAQTLYSRCWLMKVTEMYWVGATINVTQWKDSIGPANTKCSCDGETITVQSNNSYPIPAGTRLIYRGLK